MNEHRLLTNHSKQEEKCHTNVCLPTLCYRFHSDTLLLALPVSWGYQTQRYYIKPSSKLNHKLSSSLQIADELSHCIPSFSQVFDECRISDQQRNFYVKIYIHYPQYFSSACEVSHDGRMLDTILCADDRSVMPQKLLHSVF